MARHISHTETNKLIRATLKREFPGVKFSVRCGAGSSTATYITWTDGPAEEAVQEATSDYVGSRPDYTGDYWDTRYTTDEHGEEVSYGSNHIFTRRKISAPIMDKAETLTAKLLGVDTVYDVNYTTEEYGANLHAVEEFTGKRVRQGYAYGETLTRYVAERLAECAYLGVDAEAELENRRRQSDLEAATFRNVRANGGTFEDAHKAVRALTDPKGTQADAQRAEEYAKAQQGIIEDPAERAQAEAAADEQTAHELLADALVDFDPRYLAAFSMLDNLKRGRR